MCILQHSEFYHIYNHAVSGENLFREEGNYVHFLKRYTDFIHPIAHTYAYCLMPDHFHLLIKIRREEELVKNLKIKPGELQHEGNFEGLNRKMIFQFSNLFNSYTKSFNKYYGRKGALFSHHFKKKQINRDAHFTSIVRYIHRKPIHHGFCNTIDDWYWSSYHTYLNSKQTLLEKEKTLEWFGGKEKFVKLHNSIPVKKLQLVENNFIK
ncbi:MAG: Transposase [Bacteroidota bacterium]|nr:Transposase [Bacteroidota bacterium]